MDATVLMDLEEKVKAWPDQSDSAIARSDLRRVRIRHDVRRPTRCARPRDVTSMQRGQRHPLPAAPRAAQRVRVLRRRRGRRPDESATSIRPRSRTPRRPCCRSTSAPRPRSTSSRSATTCCRRRRRRRAAIDVQDAVGAAGAGRESASLHDARRRPRRRLRPPAHAPADRQRPVARGRAADARPRRSLTARRSRSRPRAWSTPPSSGRCCGPSSRCSCAARASSSAASTTPSASCTGSSRRLSAARHAEAQRRRA